MKKTPAVPTIVDVARLAGVGVGTASRALRKDGYLKEETIRRVTAAARSLGYVRNELARSLKERRSRVIGIVIPDIGGPFMADCIRSAQAVFRESDFTSVIAFTDGKPDVEAHEIEYLCRRQIDGLLVVPAYSEVKHFRSRHISALPVVAFDQPVRNLKIDAVLVENREGAKHAVQHLVQHGHHRIGCIGVNGHLYSIQERVEGYRETIQLAGLRESLCIVSPGDNSIAKTLGRWLRAKHPPTAVFSANELTSIELLHAIAALGVKVPDQLAIVGFDDVQLGSLLPPPLTAVLQPARRIGSEAATLLVRRILRPALKTGDRVLLKTELVVRASCGCNG